MRWVVSLLTFIILFSDTSSAVRGHLGNQQYQDFAKSKTALQAVCKVSFQAPDSGTVAFCGSLIENEGRKYILTAAHPFLKHHDHNSDIQVRFLEFPSAPSLILKEQWISPELVLKYGNPQRDDFKEIAPLDFALLPLYELRNNPDLPPALTLFQTLPEIIGKAAFYAGFENGEVLRAAGVYDLEGKPGTPLTSLFVYPTQGTPTPTQVSRARSILGKKRNMPIGTTEVGDSGCPLLQEYQDSELKIVGINYGLFSDDLKRAPHIVDNTTCLPTLSGSYVIAFAPVSWDLLTPLMVDKLGDLTTKITYTGEQTESSTSEIPPHEKTK